ncbi:hypothetical protein HDV00_010843 [Rhizophlyctis rosea]|nr:hypothetical protein HDV00_010843 [Rhizophlyctis rosea]
MSSNKVFIGGLAWETTGDSLRNKFEEYGDVTDAIVITDRETGRSRGFGFVTFADPKGAQKAVEGMNERELDGRTVRVDLANDRPPREDRGSRGPPRSFGGDRGYDDRRNGGGRSYGGSSGGGGGGRYEERRSYGGSGGSGGGDRYGGRDDDRRGGRSGPYDRPSGGRGGDRGGDRSSSDRSRRDDY